MNLIPLNSYLRWNTVVIDGHDVEAVCRAFHEAETSKDRPTAILAKTYKGKGVPGMLTKFIILIKFNYTSAIYSASCGGLMASTLEC